MERTDELFCASCGADYALPYLLYRPRELEPAPALMLFLHGSGERGEDLTLLRSVGLPVELERGRELPCLVLVPQCPLDSCWEAQEPAVLALLDRVMAAHGVDPGRVCLTGLSMGGDGSWDLGRRHPERFCAIAPLCGGLQRNYIDLARAGQALRQTPVWAFHGARDDVIPLSWSEQAVAAVQAAGGDARLTVYPEADHNCWSQAYADDALYDWLLRPR